MAAVPIVGLGRVERVDQVVEAVTMVREGRLTMNDIGFLEEACIAKAQLPML